MAAVASESLSCDMDLYSDSNVSTPYASAPSSPSRTSFSGSPGFDSTPASPTRGLSDVPVWESQGALPKCKRSKSDGIDFEFQPSFTFGSLCQEQKQQQQHKMEESPTMSYADELFKNGQVLPLKPPPCLQSANLRSLSASATYSRSAKLGQGGTFSGLNCRHKDPNPFQVALERVRNEELDEYLNASCTRSKSQSQMRNEYWAFVPNRGMDHSKPIGHSARPILPMKLEPLFGAPTNVSRPSSKAAKRWQSVPEVSMQGMMKDFPFRSSSHGISNSKDKERDPTASLNKIGLTWNSSLKLSQEIQFSEMKKKPKKEKRTKTPKPYKPGMFSCLGFSSKEREEDQNPKTIQARHVQLLRL